MNKVLDLVPNCKQRLSAELEFQDRAECSNRYILKSGSVRSERNRLILISCEGKRCWQTRLAIQYVRHQNGKEGSQCKYSHLFIIIFYISCICPIFFNHNRCKIKPNICNLIMEFIPLKPRQILDRDGSMTYMAGG